MTTQVLPGGTIATVPGSGTSSMPMNNTGYQGSAPAHPLTSPATYTTAPGQFVPTAQGQPNFYYSSGISPQQVNSIGAPLSGYVDGNGQRVVGNSAASAIDAAVPSFLPGLGDMSDPAYAGSEYDPSSRVAGVDWSVANPGNTGLFGFPANPHQPAQVPPRQRLPMMAAGAPAAAAHAVVNGATPLMAAAAPVARTPVQQYRVLHPDASPSQAYNAVAAPAAAQAANPNPVVAAILGNSGSGSRGGGLASTSSSSYNPTIVGKPITGSHIVISPDGQTQTYTLPNGQVAR